MAKKICTPPKDYSEHIARTKKIVDKWLKELDPEDQAMAAKVLHQKLLHLQLKYLRCFQD